MNYENKEFIVLLVLMFNMSCEKDSSNSAILIETRLRLSFISNDSVDLLAPENNEAYTNIEVYQLDGDTKKGIYYSFAPSSMTDLQFDYLSFNIENDNKYFIKLNEEETDTVIGITEKIENSIFLTKIIYNNSVKTLQDSTGIYKIIKD